MLKSVIQVWFTVQDALQFADGGVSAERAKKNLTALVNKHGAPVGFHRGRWKPVDGPREGGAGKWSALHRAQGLHADTIAVGTPIDLRGRCWSTVAGDECARAGV